ncbi:MAG: ATP-binding protein [Thermodesulfobacteriota bacterium]|nr:ATP-binding protein [Thermodesulfobacteriota bacterium]
MGILPEKETLTVEFKSDRNCLSDHELLETVVAMANTQGGELYLGVEDDGTPTGLHPNHLNTTGLAALIGNRTQPALAITVKVLKAGTKTIACISVPQNRALVATSDGKILRRRLKTDGMPENIPLYPHEIPQRQAFFRLSDLSSKPVGESCLEDLDPLERGRLRSIIQKQHGEKGLLDLSDEELDGALGLTTVTGGSLHPTLAGLLLIGKEESLRRLVPTHEAAFQVLEGTEVRVNEFLRYPLLRLFDYYLEQFNARNQEQELEDGLFRVPVPDFDQRAFREALVNALTHRDYAMMGCVHVRMNHEGLTLSNPGGFVEGVFPDNLLTVEPRPRNPYLADALKRIGLAERTGRGVDRIYEGMLRFGRPAPDYTGSNETLVVLKLQCTGPDMDFIRMIIREEERVGKPLPLDALIILSRLREERRLDANILSKATQRNLAQTRGTLQRLLEAGLIESRGAKRGKTYMLSAKVYRRSGRLAEYVRQAGFDPIQQEQMVITYIGKHGRIKRGDVADLCRISPFQATRLLRRLKESGRVVARGRGKGTYYVPRS